MPAHDVVRLCRMWPRVVACLRERCAHYERATGRCRIEPTPPDHWKGDAYVIEVSRERYRVDDLYWSDRA